MVAPAVEGIDLFKIAGRSISGWIPSLKTGTAVRQPFCSQLEERLLLWLEYHPQVKCYARGDIGPQFVTSYRLRTPKHAPFAIGYTFEGKPHDYLPDVVGTLTKGKLFITEAGMEDDKRSDRNLAKAEAVRRLARLQRGVFWIGTERTLTKLRHYNLVFLHTRRKTFPAFADIAAALREVWLTGDVAAVCEVASRLEQKFPANLVEAAIWKVVGHTSEEVREILATLETVYRELFPQLNLRRWAGSIYTWLTQPVLDPINSGRVTMDYLMKLVTTALEWSYEASETDMRAETLEKAAQLLVLRRDTFQIIDGAGPSVEVSRPDPAEPESANGTELLRETVRANGQQNTTETVETVEEQVQTSKSPICTFSRVVSIDLKRFADSGIALVECPDCSRTHSLSPHKGVLRFPSHDKRKISTPNTMPRWAMCETVWEIIGGESK